MNQKDILRIRQLLQTTKRILYPMTNDKALTTNQIKLLLKAYKTLEQVARSLNDPYDL